MARLYAVARAKSIGFAYNSAGLPRSTESTEKRKRDQQNAQRKTKQTIPRVLGGVFSAPNANLAPQRFASVAMLPKPNKRSSAVTRVNSRASAVAAKKRSAGSW